MTISENASVFFGQQVTDFESADDWKGPKRAYRLRVSWDTPQEVMHERLKQLANQPDSGKLSAIVIGFWGPESTSPSDDVIKALVRSRDRLTNLRAIFLGDITYEENEISWIEQSDVSPLLRAYPDLTVLRVRGGNSLKFSKIKHESLRQLIIESGGLPRSVIREICRCEFPNLEDLELWLGAQNYGWDGGAEDLQPILEGKLFPKLECLGLRDSEIIDEIVPVVVNAPIIKRIKVLDLSLGNLTDSGAKALLSIPEDSALEMINLTHHYMTEAMVKNLKEQLTCEVVADNPREPEDDWRSIAVSE
jgi:hypothetical protein